jgi:Tfp pilus assembly pilus retraction ATPase PilT
MPHYEIMTSAIKNLIREIKIAQASSIQTGQSSKMASRPEIPRLLSMQHRLAGGATPKRQDPRLPRLEGPPWNARPGLEVRQRPVAL